MSFSRISTNLYRNQSLNLPDVKHIEFTDLFCFKFQAVNRWEFGDYKRAQAWAKKAKFIAIVTIICGIIFWVGVIKMAVA